MSEETPTKDAPKKKSGAERLEQGFESFLWSSRLVILLGVGGLLLTSAVVFMIGLFESIAVAGTFADNVIHHGLHLDKATYDGIIVQVITAVDDFLLGIVLLIFGLGTYDLFVSRIDIALEQDDIRPDWLVFGSLDELKSVLGKVVLMILTINFFKIVVNMKFAEPIHLLYLGGGIALVSLALRLSHASDIDRTKAHGKGGH